MIKKISLCFGLILILITCLIGCSNNSENTSNKNDTVTTKKPESMRKSKYTGRVGWIDDIYRYGADYNYLYVSIEQMPPINPFRGKITNDTKIYFSDFYENKTKETSFSKIEDLCKEYYNTWNEYSSYPNDIILEMTVNYEYDSKNTDSYDFNNESNEVISIIIKPEFEKHNDAFINKYIN